MSEINKTPPAITENDAKKLLDPPVHEGMKHGMLNELERTTDARLRNTIALKLAESGFVAAIPVLIRLMDSVETTGNRGTLLYAIDELGAKLPPKHLLHLMMTDTYEVQTQAFEMLEDTVNDCVPDDLRIMLNWVLDITPTLDSEHREAAAVASELLVSTFIERSGSY